MRLNIRLFCTFTAGLLLVAGVASLLPVMADEDPLLVIVNGDRPERELSRSELTRLFNGEKQFWLDHSRVRIVLPPKGSAETVAHFYAYLGTSRSQLRREWTRLLFRGAVSYMPDEPATWSELVEEILENKDAIAVIPRSALRETSVKGIRVLMLNGKLPEDRGYPL